MKKKHWIWLTTSLLITIVLAVLLLAPASPLSITRQSVDGEPEQLTSTPDISTPEIPSEASAEQDSPTIEDLIEATRDPVWKVRWDAVNALGNLKDPRGLPALAERALYDDNTHPRWRSLWALASVDPDGSQAVSLLRDGLQDADPEVVRNAAVALAFFAQPEALPELHRGLKDPDPFRRWEAAFSLREIGGPEEIQALTPLLDEKQEPDSRVRGEVALTLGRIGGDEGVPALIYALQKDPASEVRRRCAIALAMFQDPSVVGNLEQALANEGDLQVRKAIEDALRGLP